MLSVAKEIVLKFKGKYQVYWRFKRDDMDSDPVNGVSGQLSTYIDKPEATDEELLSLAQEELKRWKLHKVKEATITIRVDALYEEFFHKTVLKRKYLFNKGILKNVEDI